MPQVIIAVVITLIITAVAVWFISTEYHKKVANTKIGNAEEQARGIIDVAAVRDTHFSVIGTITSSNTAK